MNRRQLLTLSLLTLLTRGKTLAAKEGSIPECTNLRQRVGNWETRGGDFIYQIWDESPSGPLGLTFTGHRKTRTMEREETISIGLTNNKPRKNYEGASETGLFVLSCTVFIDGKKVFKNDKRGTSVDWVLGERELTLLRQGNTGRIDCELVPGVKYKRYNEGTKSYDYDATYEYKYRDVQEETFSFSPKKFIEAYDVVKKNHEKAYWDKEQGRCYVPRRSNSDCFITTATCGAVGLADDCFELTRLVARLDHLELLKLYWLYILPSSIMAWLRLDRLTYRHYKRMVRGLKGKYLSVG